MGAAEARLLRLRRPGAALPSPGHMACGVRVSAMRLAFVGDAAAGRYQVGRQWPGCSLRLGVVTSAAFAGGPRRAGAQLWLVSTSSRE